MFVSVLVQKTWYDLFGEDFVILVAYCSRMQFCSIKFMSDDIMSDVSLINGFTFLLSIKCFVKVDGQLQKETGKLNRNLPITMSHVVL